MKGNNRILIVEDDPAVRDAYRSILSPEHRDDVLSRGSSLLDDSRPFSPEDDSRSYDVTEAETGEEGIQRAVDAVQSR